MLTRTPSNRRARAQRIAQYFGISGRTLRPRRAPVPPLPQPGEILLLCGPSGAGKTTALRQLQSHLMARPPGPAPPPPRRHARCRRPIAWRGGTRPFLRLDHIALPASRPLVDCFSLTLAGTLALLATAGLAEARLWLTPPRRLSAGEQFRFRLARWMASDIPLLLADEYAAGLDDLTARVVSWQLGRFIRRSLSTPVPRCAILATWRGDLAADLGARTFTFQT